MLPISPNLLGLMVSTRLVPSASALPGQASAQAGPPAMAMKTNRILTKRIWTLTPTLRWDLGDGFAIGLGGPAETASLGETLELAWSIAPSIRWAAGTYT